MQLINFLFIRNFEPIFSMDTKFYNNINLVHNPFNFNFILLSLIRYNVF